MCFGSGCTLFTDGTVRNMNNHSSKPAVFGKLGMTVFSISENKDIIEIKLSYRA